MNNNNSTIFAPHFEAHVSYVAGTHEVTCEQVKQVDWAEACEFVLKTATCQQRSVINYMKLMYCDLSASPLAFIIVGFFFGFIMIEAYMFLVTIGAFYSVYNSIAISHLFGLNEHNTGTVILTILNGVQDIIDIASDNESNLKTKIGYKYGNSIICASIYSGVVILLYPFKIRYPYFIRNDLFTVLIVSLIGWNVIKNKFGACLCIILWFVFLLYIGIEEILVRKRYKEKDQELPEYCQTFKIKFPISNQSSVKNAVHANSSIFKQFINDLNPIHVQEYKNSDIWGKIFLVIVCPQKVFLNIFIPVVDYTKPNHGWSKLLNCINILTTAILLPYIQYTSVGWITFISYLCAVIIIVTIIFLTSRTDRPPSYHTCFAFFGIFSAAIISQFILNELYGIWYMIANTIGLSRKNTGILINKWIMTIVDFVVTLETAGLGYPIVAFETLIASPSYHYTLLIGIYFLKAASNDVLVPMTQSDITETSIIFANIIYITLLLAAILNSFQMKKSIGIYLISMYVIFIIFVILCECDVIHPYGTSHTNDH